MNNIDERANQIIRSIDSIEKYGFKDKIKAEILDELYIIRSKIINEKYSDLENVLSRYNTIATKIWQEFLSNC